MYDRKTEANEFVAESAEDAVASAARFYGVEKSELKVSAPEDVAGLNGRVVVVAMPKGLTPQPRGRDSGGGQERREGREQGRGSRPGRDRDRGNRRGRGERRAREEEREEPREEPEDSSEAQEQPAEESKGVVLGEVGPIGEYVLGVVERMALGNFELSESMEEDSGFLVCQLRGPASNALGSGGGRIADALRLIANQASKQFFDDAPRVVIDLEGQSDERDDSLSSLADRAARRALDSGHSVALDPMNSHDRRIVHIALREMDGVATMSRGEGRYKQVLVVPESAPEYEEASRDSA